MGQFLGLDFFPRRRDEFLQNLKRGVELFFMPHWHVYMKKQLNLGI